MEKREVMKNISRAFVEFEDSSGTIYSIEEYWIRANNWGGFKKYWAADLKNSEGFKNYGYMGITWGEFKGEELTEDEFLELIEKYAIMWGGVYIVNEPSRTNMSARIIFYMLINGDFVNISAHENKRGQYQNYIKCSGCGLDRAAAQLREWGLSGYYETLNDYRG